MFYRLPNYAYFNYRYKKTYKRHIKSTMIIYTNGKMVKKLW